MALKPEDVKLVMGMVKAEVAQFAKRADQELTGELLECKQALDGANKNIFKLQAQLTGMKEMLVERGLVAREALYDKEQDAFVALVKSTQKVRALAEVSK